MLETARTLMVSQAPVLFLVAFLSGASAGEPDNITDPIRLLNHLFIGDGPPPLPGPTECGVDPTADTLAPCVYERCEG